MGFKFWSLAAEELVYSTGGRRLGQNFTGKIDESLVEHVAKPQTVENPTKKGSFSVFENEPSKRPRGDLNPQPPDRQSGGSELQPVTLPMVTDLAKIVSACASPGDQENGVGSTEMTQKESDFAAALLMIERLPLSDEQKAEAVRRLLEHSVGD